MKSLSRSECTACDYISSTPSKPLVSIVKVKESRWNCHRMWKPLSLMVLKSLTPSGWKISIVDENLGAPEYPAMPRPDLVRNFACRSNLRLNRKAYADFKSYVKAGV
jgi:hypothetical protein